MKFWKAVAPPVVATNVNPPWLRLAAFSFFCSKVARPPILKAWLPRCHEKLSRDRVIEVLDAESAGWRRACSGR